MSHTEVACSLVSSLVGADLKPYKDALLLRRLRRRAKSLGLGGVPDYLRGLEAGGIPAEQEAERLVASVSVRVSGFFRDEAVFRNLEETVFPSLVSAGRPGGEIRAWSAACADGREAYSLAMGLLRSREGKESSAQVSVLGTDVDRNAIDAAREARYPEKALAGVPVAVLARYFEPLDGGFRAVKSEVRRAVRFEARNLLRFDEYPKALDLVFCRNLLIYFKREVQEEVLLALVDSLRPGGFLVLGPGETVLGRPWALLEHVSPAHKIYRRPL